MEESLTGEEARGQYGRKGRKQKKIILQLFEKAPGKHVMFS